MLGEEFIAGIESRGHRHGIAEIVAAVGAKATPTSRPRLVFVAQVRDCASRLFCRRLASPCFVHGQAFEGAIEHRAGKSGARLRLDAALETAEDGHVAGLQVRRAVRRDEAQHDVRESGPHGGQCDLAGPEKDPRLSFLAWVQHFVQCGCELQDRGHRGPAVLRCDVASALRPGLLKQNGVCLASVHDLHQRVQRATVHAESDRECRGLPRVALQLSLLDAAAAHPI